MASADVIVAITLGITGIGVTITITLIRMVYNAIIDRMDRMDTQIHERLKALSHEDRELRAHLREIVRLVVEAVEGKQT